MVQMSNNVILLLNFITLILSVPILLIGDWLGKQSATECERWLEKPVLIFGVFLFFLSLAGLIGSCCSVSCLLWTYLFVMYLLIAAMFCFTIFAFIITNQGAGETVSGKGYKEYKLGDYSNWLQRRVNDKDNWENIKSCLRRSNLCTKFQDQYGKDDSIKFFLESLSSLQSGCCKPSSECNFKYESPTVWNKTDDSKYSNDDCKIWDNNEDILCFDCESCKAGLLHNVKDNWKKVAVVNILVTLCLILVYSIGCCALRNNRMKKYRPNYYYYY